MSIFSILITNPLGYLLGFIYTFTQNYGWALVIFTILVKLILLPLGLKQQKSMTRMQFVQPKMAEIQEKYKNDKNKQSEEMMKLYKEYKVSPMSGCLPLLIQLPILYGLYWVIREPLRYMLHIPMEQIEQMIAELGFSGYNAQILVAHAKNMINFDFLGLDLSSQPELSKPSLLWIIPILAGVTTFFTSKITTWMNKKDKKEKKEEQKPQRVLNPDQKTNNANQQEGMMKGMLYVMPLMTLWITFTVPAALGVYWTISNILSLVQTVVLNGYYANKLRVEYQAVEEQKLLEKQERAKRKKKRG